MSLPVLDDHLGSWIGSWKTFLEPGNLIDDSPIEATVTAGARTSIVEYTGTIGGDDVRGWIRWNADGSIDWIDSWHTAGEGTHLDGSPPSYDYSDGEGGTWTWDIEVVAAEGSITIIHSNTGPDIPRYTGVVMELNRPPS